MIYRRGSHRECADDTEETSCDLSLQGRHAVESEGAIGAL